MDNLEQAFYRIFLNTPEGRENYLLGVRRELQHWGFTDADIEERITQRRKGLKEQCK